MIPVAASRPIVLAHRGGDEVAPENTMSAFRSLKGMGIRYLETDVHLTADGQVVVCHDDTLERTYGGAGSILDHTYQEILELRNSAGEAMPLLSEVLETFPDLYLNIDAKTDAVADPLVDLLLDHQAMGRTLIASFSERRLERIRRMGGPEVTTSLGVRGVVNLMLAAETASSAETWGVPGPAQHVRAVQVPVKTKGIRVVSPRFIATAHTAGLAVHVWTVNDPDTMVKLVEMGVDGLITDVPMVARDVLIDMDLWGRPLRDQLLT